MSSYRGHNFLETITALVNSNRLEFVDKKLEFENKDKTKTVKLLNVPAAFDIETSSFYENNDTSDPHNKRAIMYHWQFGIYNLVTTGRTWKEFKIFLYMLSECLKLNNSRILPVYIHNMSYEWGFMRKHFVWDKVFLLDTHEPAYALMKSIGIEFRDSLILWGGKSLAKVGEDLQRYKVRKLKGDLDYKKLRTPLTPLTDKELKYCENDIRVILAGIQEEIEDNGNIAKIPLTNTQRVRIYARKNCYKHYKNYRKMINSLTLDMEEYSQLKRAFQGGFVHANPKYVANAEEYNDDVFIGQTLEKISSIDFTSKYPSVMVLRKFPMSKSIRIDKNLTQKQFESLLETHCCLFDLEIGKFPNSTIGGVKPKFYNESMWSSSKCHKGSLVNPIINNGRVYSCDNMKITCTELDYKILRKYYAWDYQTISNMRVYEKGYLPKEFVLAVLDLYERKTRLKGIHAELVSYMISKNMLNSLYGMIVTDIYREQYIYTMEHEYKKLSKIEEITIDKLVSNAIDKYNRNGNRFLFYPWGVWVTAWARYDLLNSILEFDDDYVYSDTDSIKFKNYDKHIDFINRYNDGIMKEIKNIAELRRIPITKLMPEKNGKKYPIGVWDYEGTYDFFKTQGAKRYMYMKSNSAHKWIQKRKFKIKSIKIDKKYPCVKTKYARTNISGMIYNKNLKKLYKIPQDVCLDNEGNEYVLTLAGASKINSMNYLINTYKKNKNIFRAFTSNMMIPSTHSGRLTHTYIGYETEGEVTDYLGMKYKYHELSSIHMEETQYKMKLVPEYEKFLASLTTKEYLNDKKEKAN